MNNRPRLVATADQVEMADRPFPSRCVFDEDGSYIVWDHSRMAAFLKDVAAWWLDLATAYLDLAVIGFDTTEDAADALLASGVRA